MENEIIRADSGLRRRVLWLVGAALIAASLYFAWLFGEIERVSAAQEPDLEGLVAQLRWMSLGLVGASAALCVYLWVVALQVFSSGRFPPPKTRVIRDIRLRTGNEARVVAVLGATVGSVLVALAVAVYLLITRFIEAEGLL